MSNKTSKCLIKEIKYEKGTNTRKDVIKQAEELGKANKFLAKIVQEHVQSIRKKKSEYLDWNIVSRLTQKVDLSSRTKDSLINVDEQNFVEILNQIRHIEICHKVYTFFKGKRGCGNLKHIHPTQSNGKNNKKEADIEFENAAIEVFGGSDLTSNNKFKKDVRSLCENNKSQAKYVAFYENALTGKTTQSFVYKNYYNREHPHNKKTDEEIDCKVPNKKIYERSFSFGKYKYSFSPEIITDKIKSRFGRKIILVKLDNLTSE